MLRRATADLGLDLLGPVRLALQIAAAEIELVRDEQLVIELDGRPLEPQVLEAPHGGRLHVLDVAAPGSLTVAYAVTLEGHAPPPPAPPAELLAYLRPSRYCESDRLAAVATAEFGEIDDQRELPGAVGSWVAGRLGYVSGASRPTDGAVETLLAGAGVCRDFAHVTIALLRALDVPARAVAVYAPGLSPMDFHAVAEAYVDGAWQVVDATRLAPRQSLMRIATGRDAADTAFLSNYGGAVELNLAMVSAIVADGDLPRDDLDRLVTLG